MSNFLILPGHFRRRRVCESVNDSAADIQRAPMCANTLPSEFDLNSDHDQHVPRARSLMPRNSELELELLRL